MDAKDFLRLHNETLTKEDSCFANTPSPYDFRPAGTEKFTEEEMIAFAEAYAKYVQDCSPSYFDTTSITLSEQDVKSMVNDCKPAVGPFHYQKYAKIN